MANPDLEQDELSRFFPVASRVTDLTALTDADEGEHGLLSFIRKLTIDDDLSSAANSIDDVVRAINDGVRSLTDGSLKEKVNDFIKVFTAGPKIEGATDTGTEPANYIDIKELDGTIPAVSSIVIGDQRAGPALRNTKRLQLFFNSIPTYEMSRCVPYLEVRVQSLVPPLNAAGELQRPSLYRFLQQPLTIGNQGDRTTADSIMATSEQLGGVTNDLSAEVVGQLRFTPGSFSTGMELFTAPQTLVDPLASVVDPFRPFMSLTSLRLDVAGGGNTPELSTMKGELQLVIHDRSRMGDIAEFVGAGAKSFSLVKLLITYGWAHPDGPERGNPYADLINGMRQTGYYIVANVSYQLDQAGQVHVTLPVVDAGLTVLHTVRLSEARFDSPQKVTGRLQTLIDHIQRVAATDHGAEKMRNIGIRQVLAPLSQYAALPELAAHLRPLLDKFFRHDPKLTDDAAAHVSKDGVAELLDKLEALVGLTGTDGEESDQPLAHLKSQVDQHLRRKIDGLLEGNDPFQPALLTPQLQHRKLDVTVEKTAEFVEQNGPVYVSLGKVMASLIAPALLRGSDLVNEVQFIYYPFNERAGAAAGMSTASFMFEFERFRSDLQRLAFSKGTIDMSLSELLHFIRSQVEDSTQFFYDVTDVKPGKDTTDKRVKSKGATKKEIDKGRAAADTATEERVMQDGGVFAQGVLQFELETIPIVKADPASGVTQAGRRTLMRIHVMDKAASPFVGAKQLLAGSVEHELYSLTKGTAPEILQKAIAKGLVSVVANGSLRLNTSGKNVKSFVKSLVPSVTYGSNNSVVMNAGLASQGDPLMTTDSVQRMAKNSVLMPPGSSLNGLPVQVMPIRLDTEMLGNPLIRKQQQLFWDFSTDTNADDIYSVVKYTHEISPGKFTTRAEWVPSSGYPAYYSSLGAIQRAIGQLKEIGKKIE